MSEYFKPLYAYKWTLHCIIEDDIKQQGRQDIMHDPHLLWCTYWSWSKRKDCIALCYTAPAGCLSDRKPQFNFRTKIEDGKQKTNTNL